MAKRHLRLVSPSTVNRTVRPRERELEYEEAIQRLAEIFSNRPSAPSRRCRKSFLEYQDGEPVFRLAEMPSKPALPRDEIEVAFDEVMVELFGLVATLFGTNLSNVVPLVPTTCGQR